MLLAILTISTLGLPSVFAAVNLLRTTRFEALAGLDKRQSDVCVPVSAPVTCGRSCGPGNIQCIAYPHCYNPSAGETCCENGEYCSAGTRCTDAGCCPLDSPLEDCGATRTLSTIAPPPPSTTYSSSTSTSTSLESISSPSTSATSVTTSLVVSTSTTIPSSISSIIPSSLSSIVPSTSSEVLSTTYPAPDTSTTTTSPIFPYPSGNATTPIGSTGVSTYPVQQTVNAGAKSDAEVFGLALGGFGLFLNLL